MSHPNDEFDQIVQGFNVNPAPGSIDPNPYGAYSQRPKPGLTTRGKVALGLGVAIVASGSFIGYEIHETNSVKEQEIALRAQQIQLEKLREMDRASETTQQAQTAQEQARQASINSCVKDHSSDGSSYLGVVNECQAQYPGPAANDDLQTIAATQNTGSGTGEGALILGGIAIVGVAFAAKKGTRSNQA